MEFIMVRSKRPAKYIQQTVFGWGIAEMLHMLA